MFGTRFELFKLFGFPIRIDLSWFVVVALITWSLARGWFPQSQPGLEVAVYWWMGLAGALGLFASVLLHELAHALVARRHGVTMSGITLFIFGGVAEMTDEPGSPRVELLIAIAGPIASVLLGGALFATTAVPWPAAADAVLQYLAFLNVVLAVFNLIPAFPLDGGRVLRAALWQWRGSLRRATRITSQIGSGFGAGLIVLGLVALLVANQLVGGLWWILIGLFLRQAARMAYQQLLLRQTLEGERVARFMVGDPVTVPRRLSLREVVEEYVYKHHFKMFPVVEDGRLVGCITTRDIKAVPHEEWDRTTVGAAMQGCGEGNTIGPDQDAMEALAKMSRGAASRLMVVEGDRLLGIVALKDLLELFSLKVELEE